MTRPRYQDIQGDGIPEAEVVPGVRARVIAGELYGVSGAVTRVATEPVYFDLALDVGARIDVPLPAGHNAFVYVFEGRVSAGPDGDGTPVERGELALLSPGSSVELEAGSDPARLILVAGRPLNEPIARYGPFVMNTNEELQQAFVDYQSGRL
jgi:redox-sensitive bicupin YhaK (pirin superfamily)